MLENIKKRIIHFYTRGNIIEDFVEARRKKAAMLRRIIHACFYIQCALAVCCIAAALLMRAGGTSAVIVGSAAVCVVAFISLGGGTAEKTVLYILDLVYAVICFLVGGLGGSPAFTVCGALMLLSAAVALCGFFAAWCRQYLLDFSPAKLTRGDYTRLSLGSSEEEPRQSPPPAPRVPAPPPPPPKTEMEMLAERLSDILGSIPDVKTAPEASASRESASEPPAVSPSQADGNHAAAKSNNGSAVSSDIPAANGDTKAAPAASPADGAALKPKAESSAALPTVVEAEDIFGDLSIDG